MFLHDRPKNKPYFLSKTVLYKGWWCRCVRDRLLEGRRHKEKEKHRPQRIFVPPCETVIFPAIPGLHGTECEYLYLAVPRCEEPRTVVHCTVHHCIVPTCIVQFSQTVIILFENAHPSKPLHARPLHYIFEYIYIHICIYICIYWVPGYVMHVNCQCMVRYFHEKYGKWPRLQLRLELERTTSTNNHNHSENKCSLACSAALQASSITREKGHVGCQLPTRQPVSSRS